MEEKSPRNRSSVRIFKVLLFMVGLFYTGEIAISFHYYPQIWGSFLHLGNSKILVTVWSLILDYALTALLYVAIIYQLFRLLGFVTKGDPFNQNSPRRIRRIAYCTFGMAAVNVSTDLARSLTLAGLPSLGFWPNTMNIFLRGTRAVLFGIGILIIAVVLEAGVKLQQDQNLTV